MKLSIGSMRAFMAALLLCTVQMVSAQSKLSVSGVVSDQNGAPIIGVTVFEDGTTNGVSTDIDGKYTLSVKPDAVVRFSIVGYVSSEIKVTKAGVYDVTLNEDTQLIDEVVVIGYGVVRKVDVAGSISVMDSKSYKDQPIIEVSDALQGRMAGVQVEPSGVPGGSVKIRIRGSNSVNKTNDPLYVVNGIVRESGLEGLNSDDIESIQVLKDASSTAIYGSRGSNGVVLVTTKAGKENQSILSFEAKVGISSIYKTYDLMNAYEYAQAYMDIKGNPNAFTQEELASYKNGTGGVDWQKTMFRDAVTQDYRLVFSKGFKGLQFYASGNYTDQQGVFIYTGMKRYNGHVNVASDVTKWLHLDVDVNASHVDRHGGGGFSGGGKSNPIWQIASYSPSMELMAEDGIHYNFDNYNSINRSPYGIAKEEGADTRVDILNAMVNLRFNIAKGLTFSTTNGMDYREYKNYTFGTTRVETQSSMSNNLGNRRQLQSTNNLTYNGKWGKHSLTATGVFEITANRSSNVSISGTNLQTESVGYWNVSLAASRKESNGYSEWSLASGVGRLIYNYGDRYLVTGTFRADGSSKFTNNKWGFFPSAAVAWTFSNEKFMKNQKVLSNGKLRASYGIVGSQAVEPYGTLGMLSSANFSYGGGSNYPGYWAYTLATPDLTWEKTKQVDVGIDLGFLDGTIDLALDYYYKRTYDALLQKQIPNYDGGGTYWVNAGTIDNTGFEAAITGRLFQGKSVNWTTTLTGTANRNEVVDLAGDEFIDGRTPASGMIGSGVSRAAVGQPIGVFYLYEWDGIDSATGANKYVDHNGDGKIDSNDRIYVGKPTPTFTFGWNNSVTWRNWDLNVFFTAAVGADRLNIVRFAAASQVGDSRFITLRDAYYNSWDQNKENPKYATQKGSTQNYPNSTQYLEKADYLRLQNLSLSYTFGKKMIKFADLRLSISVQNLFTISGYSGLDPTAYEFSNGHADVNSGIDMGGYPNPRTITFGAKFNF